MNGSKLKTKISNVEVRMGIKTILKADINGKDIQVGTFITTELVTMNELQKDIPTNDCLEISIKSNTNFKYYGHNSTDGITTDEIDRFGVARMNSIKIERTSENQVLEITRGF